MPAKAKDDEQNELARIKQENEELKARLEEQQATTQPQSDLAAVMQRQLASVQRQLADHETRLTQPQAQALVAEITPTPKLDQTVPGGRYIVDITPDNPSGRMVDANGKPINDKA
jgi:hypothetical protein